VFKRRPTDPRPRAAEPPAAEPPHLSFGGWDRLSPGEVVQVCHPRWRGVRTVAYSFRTPVVECDDLDLWTQELVVEMAGASPSCVVVQGWPPGSETLVRGLHAAGIKVKCLLHSSPAQHGAEVGEAAVVEQVLKLASDGILDGVGMAKAGLTRAFAALGFPVSYVPNRAPALEVGARKDLGEGLQVGVFAEPFWRKNVVTQLLAVAQLGATAHVMTGPAVGYLGTLDIVEHGELPYDRFVELQGSVDLNLYVTLSECHPSTPQESYLYGVPCLMSRTSAVFRSDDVLWDLTTVPEADNPAAIAAAAARLMERKEEAVGRAMQWIEDADRIGEAAWAEFVGG
jgi:hypothetical protein